MPLSTLNGADYYSKYVGETEQNLRRIFRTLDENAPNILVIDEVEAILPNRDSLTGGDSGVSTRATNMWFEYLGKPDRKTIVIGLTNRIGAMDIKAGLRPGRFDRVIPRFLPDAYARGEVWRVHTTVNRKIPLAKDVDKQQIVDATWMWNCAEIEQLAKDSAFKAFIANAEFVTMDHVSEAISDTKVNLEVRQQTVEEIIRDIKNIQRYDASFLNQAIQSMQRGESKENASRLDALVNSI
jgi:transitional endoplasmic reticulum ATPase